MSQPSVGPIPGSYTSDWRLARLQGTHASQIGIAQLQVELANDFVHRTPLQEALHASTTVLIANAAPKPRHVHLRNGGMHVSMMLLTRHQIVFKLIDDKDTG